MAVVDLHVHTRLCRHAVGEPAEYVSAAADRGVGVLAFCDHLPLLDRDDTDYAMSRAELPVYVEAVREAVRLGDGPEVLLGIEADWMPGREDETSALLETHAFDVVLGSVHFIGDWAFDDPRLRDRYDEWGITDLWERYFEEFGRAAQSGIFDVMAHPDLIKKFGSRPSGDVSHLYEGAASAMAEGGVAVEVSTAGLRKPVGEIYPDEAFLTSCRRAGVRATVGSDAHDPREVAHAFEAAAELLSRAGYTRIVVYREREAMEVEL